MHGLRWLLVLGFLTGALLSRAAAEPFDFHRAEWEELDESQGVQTFRWRPPGRDLFAFKAVGVIDAPIAKLASILEDWKHQTEWVPDLRDTRVVRQLSSMERVQYMHFGTPFMVKDRDFVLRGRVDYDLETHVMRIDFHSVVDEQAPESEMVRGEILGGDYLLEPLDDGKKTRFTMRFYLDPNGSLPRWIVNLTQRSFARKTIGALRKRAARKDIPDHPTVRAALEGKIKSEAEALDYPTGF